jgi:hypothetical protein
MYRNVLHTTLVLLTAVIAVKLWRPSHTPPPPAPNDEAAFAANRRLLETRIPDLDLRNVTVGEAIETIRKATHVPIAVNWQSLDELRKRPVDIELRDVTLGDAVQCILCLDRFNGVQFGLSQADFDVVDGTLVIGATSRGNQTSGFPPRTLRMRVYDVRDLLSDAYWGYQSTGGQKMARGDSRLDELQNLVQSYSGMKNWERQGITGSFSGHEPEGFASIYGFAGRLFTVQTTYGHMRTEAFLERLRALDKGGR